MALPIFQRTVVTQTGDIIAGAEVTVINEVTGQNAVLFSNRAGTTSKTNPFTTGADGFAQFYAAAGKYRVTATGTGGTVTWRWIDLPREAATTAQAIAGTAGVVPDAATALAAYRANMVGTVSQSGGVPTGAIIQRGSNTNGEFVRFADGTQICTRRGTVGGLSGQSIVNINATGGFRSPQNTVPFAISFSAAPVTSCAIVNNSDGINIRCFSNSVNNAQLVLFTTQTSLGAPDTELTWELTAVGRWY